jgi:hypothetical protein
MTTPLTEAELIEIERRDVSIRVDDARELLKSQSLVFGDQTQIDAAETVRLADELLELIKSGEGPDCPECNGAGDCSFCGRCCEDCDGSGKMHERQVDDLYLSDITRLVEAARANR